RFLGAINQRYPLRSRSCRGEAIDLATCGMPVWAQLQREKGFGGETMLVLGYKASTEQFPPNELLDYVVEAENADFDSVDASDHFHPWRNDGVHCSFVWTWLGAVATRTKKIHLGTGVTCPTIRYNPAVVAEMAAT